MTYTDILNELEALLSGSENSNTNQLLIEAIKEERTDLVKTLLNYLNPNIDDNSALNAAIHTKSPEIIQILLDDKRVVPTNKLVKLAELLLDDPRVSNLTFEELKSIHNPKIGLLIAKKLFKERSTEYLSYILNEVYFEYFDDYYIKNRGYWVRGLMPFSKEDIDWLLDNGAIPKQGTMKFAWFFGVGSRFLKLGVTPCKEDIVKAKFLLSVPEISNTINYDDLKAKFSGIQDIIEFINNYQNNA